VILDGTGNAQNVPNIGSASALKDCLLAVHDYSFFGSDTWKTESQWVNHFKGEVGSYADRTVCTEWGGPMSPGSKNGTSYGTLDYSKSPTNYFEAYIRGMSSQLRDWKMGSFYWAGLKDTDWYSMTMRSGTGSNTVLSVPNASGLAQLENAWSSGTAGAGGTSEAGAGGIGGATPGTEGGGGLAGTSSMGQGGSMVGTGGASGGTTTSAGGSQASLAGTGGLALGSAGNSASGAGSSGLSSPTDAGGDASTGCSCTVAKDSRNSAGGLALLTFAAIGVARRRKSRRGWVRSQSLAKSVDG
jgi:MYXO-CTERM domain-containing protein